MQMENERIVRLKSRLLASRFTPHALEKGAGAGEGEGEGEGGVARAVAVATHDTSQLLSRLATHR